MLPLSAGENWPTWRGPSGDGVVASESESYATEWSSDQNILWKTDLRAPGNSSPVIWGDRVFITQGEDGNRRCSLICFDAKDGRQLWDQHIDRGEVEPAHTTNPGVSASPITDGRIVVAWFGNAGLHAYDLDGKRQWSADLGQDYAHIWGPNAGSPVFFKDRIIVYAGPGLATRLFAVDANDGSIAWKKHLPEAESEKVGEFKGSWTTPRLIESRGRDEVIVPLPDHLVSFAPSSGEELWRCAGLGKLYYTNVLVCADYIAPSPEGLQLVATNRLTPPQDNANSTPAFANGVIYLRTPSALFAIRSRRG